MTEEPATNTLKNTAPFVCVRDLSKKYTEGDHAHSVFTDLQLEIGQGHFAAVLGSSGSGKSTLLNLIAGIDLPDSGHVAIDGQTISTLNETARTRWRRRHIGFVFQFFNLIPTLTVAENLSLPLELNKLQGAAHSEHARYLLAQVGLEQRADSFPERLSGGEQQRLAIIRALVHGPRLLLADEPTGNLDTATGERVLTLLLELSQQAGATVLMVTHDQAIAQRADRRLYLQAGRIEDITA